MPNVSTRALAIAAVVAAAILLGILGVFSRAPAASLALLVLALAAAAVLLGGGDGEDGPP